MAELKTAKRALEQEVDTHKTRLRLHMEAQVQLTLFNSKRPLFPLYSLDEDSSNEFQMRLREAGILLIWVLLASNTVIVNLWQAMEEHRVRQARIVDALEEEKKKISRELEEMQRKRAFRENQTPRHGESGESQLFLHLPQTSHFEFFFCLPTISRVCLAFFFFHTLSVSLTFHYYST